MPAASRPPPGDWTEPVRPSEMPYAQPALVVDDDGYAHVAAVREDAVFHLTNRTGSWTEQRLSTPPGTGLQAQADGQPSIAIDDDGTLSIAFTRWGPADTFGRLPMGIYHTTDRAGTWSVPTLVVDDPAGGHSPSLAVRDGRMHLAYVLGVGVDLVTPDMSLPVRYGSADETGAWTDVEVAGNGTEPVLRLGSDGRAHILFGDEYGLLEPDALRLAVGAGNGTIVAEVLEDTSRYARPYDLALVGQRVHTVWSRPGWTSSDARWAAYHQSRDDTWTEPQQLMVDGTARAVAAAADGALHVVGSNLEGVWYGRGGGGPWSTLQLSGSVELWSDIAVDREGRPHVVYVVGESGTDELWYTVGPAD